MVTSDRKRDEVNVIPHMPDYTESQRRTAIIFVVSLVVYLTTVLNTLDYTRRILDTESGTYEEVVVV